MIDRYSPKTKYNVGFTQYKNVDIAKGKAFAISSSNVPVQVTIEIRQHINDFLNRDSLAGEEVMLMVCTFDHDSYPIIELLNHMHYPFFFLTFNYILGWFGSRRPQIDRLAQ